MSDKETQCWIVGPNFPDGEIDWRCAIHAVDAALRDPKRFGEPGLRREDFRCPVGEPEMSMDDRIYVQVALRIQGELRWIDVSEMEHKNAARFVDEDPTYRRFKPVPMPEPHLEECSQRTVRHATCCCDNIRNALGRERDRFLDEIMAIRVHTGGAKPASADYMRGMIDTRTICAALVKRENPL